MLTRLLLAALLFSATLAPARDKNENWVQITSPHFVVVTNSSEKDGRRIADQFERMRSLFHALFSKTQMDAAGAPVIVLAIKDEKEFRALEPQQYLAKGSLKLGGAVSVSGRQELCADANRRRRRSSLLGDLSRVHAFSFAAFRRVDAALDE